MRNWLFLGWVALGLVACPRAVQMGPNGAEGPMVFDSPDGWSVVKNQQVFFNRIVVYEESHDCCFLRIEAIREGDTARNERLSVVAEALTLARGRHLGLRTELLGSQDILVAERRAWAPTYRFDHGPLSRMGTSVHLRGGPFLVILTLQGLEPLEASSLQVWDTFLSSFQLPIWPAVEETLFEPETDETLQIYLGD